MIGKLSAKAHLIEVLVCCIIVLVQELDVTHTHIVLLALLLRKNRIIYIRELLASLRKLILGAVVRRQSVVDIIVVRRALVAFHKVTHLRLGIRLTQLHSTHHDIVVCFLTLGHSCRRKHLSNFRKLITSITPTSGIEKLDTTLD